MPNVFGNFEDPYFSTTELLNVSEGIFKEFSLFKVQVHYLDGIFLSAGKTVRLKLKIVDNGESKIQRWITTKCYADDGITLSKKLGTDLLQNTYGFALEKEITVTCEQVNGETIDVFFDFKIEGQSSQNVLKVTFFVQ